MDSHWDRREFLRATGAGVMGLGLAEGLALRALGEPKNAIPKAKAKSVIGIYLEGGLSHIDTFDPKPNAPPTVRSLFKPIPTNVPGTEISELLPLMAKAADKYTIIRSTTAPGGGHGGYVMLCNAMNPKEAARAKLPVGPAADGIRRALHHGPLGWRRGEGLVRLGHARASQ